MVIPKRESGAKRPSLSRRIRSGISSVHGLPLLHCPQVKNVGWNAMANEEHLAKLWESDLD